MGKKHILLQNQELLKWMILSLVAMTELKKCCKTNAYLQWLFHSGERAMSHWPLVDVDPTLEGAGSTGKEKEVTKNYCHKLLSLYKWLKIYQM